jgi:hypothetical protein
MYSIACDAQSLSFGYVNERVACSSLNFPISSATSLRVFVMLQKHPLICNGLPRLARNFFILCCVLLAFASASRAEQPFMTVDGDTKSIAWWVLADFHPFTTEVRGISVGQIRKEWCKATEFRKDLIPKEFLFEGGGDAMEASGLSFAIEGSFDGTKSRQVALVGTYQECSGQKGRFILILDLPATGQPKIRFVNAVPTPHQFGALSLEKNNVIAAWACMDCDNVSKLKWDRKRRKFVWLPDPTDE